VNRTPRGGHGSRRNNNQKINEGHNARLVIEARRRDHPGRYHDDDDSNCFPAFTTSITDKSFPKDFKPVGIPKYDSKQDLRQWLPFYSVAIEVLGGSNSTKALYFQVALEFAPLTWPESLKSNSIDSWEDLKRAFIDNFQGSMIRAGTHHNLSQVKQEMNKTLRSYTRCFFEMHATIANITDENVIRCLFLKSTYHDFGRNHPTTAKELRDMMARWADQEDEENDRFPKRNHDKQGNGNGHFNKSQRNHSGNTQKHKPNQEVAAIERNPHGKKLGNNHSDYVQVMHKQLPIHLKSRHTLFECVTIRKSLNAPPLPQAGKRNDKEDDEEGGDKLGAQDFQDPKNIVNVIFGGDG
jgi:hypothetical protein